MKKSSARLLALAVVFAGATLTTTAFAQYTGPSHKPSIQTVASAAKINKGSLASELLKTAAVPWKLG